MKKYGNVKFHSTKLQSRACYQTVAKILKRISEIASREFDDFNARQIRFSHCNLKSPSSRLDIKSY